MLGRFLSPCCASALLLAVGLQTSHNLFGQDKLLPVFSFQRVKGLSNDQVRSRVVRDQDGFVWIGTLNGLARFDGYSIREYRNTPDKPGTLSSNVVKALLVDRKQRLWVGTYEMGLSLYDRTTDGFFNLLPRAGDTSWYHAKTIVGILEDRHGNLWLASSDAGVMRMELPSGLDTEISNTLLSDIRFTTYTLGTPGNSASDLVERSDGKIVVASDSGIIIIDPITHSLSRLNDTSPSGGLLDKASVACLRRDSNDVLWAGTETEGLFRIDWNLPSVQNYRHVRGNAHSVMSNNIQDIAIADGGSLWLGTVERIQLFSPEMGSGIPYLTIGLNSNEPTYYSLSVDGNGTLWVGKFDGGVYWLSRKSRLIPHFAIPDSSGTGPRRFDTIERDRIGSLWFTSAEMVYRVDMMSQRVLKAIDVFRGKKTTYVNRVSFIDNFWCKNGFQRD